MYTTKEFNKTNLVALVFVNSFILNEQFYIVYMEEFKFAGKQGFGYVISD